MFHVIVCYYYFFFSPRLFFFISLALPHSHALRVFFSLVFFIAHTLSLRKHVPSDEMVSIRHNKALGDCVFRELDVVVSSLLSFISAYAPSPTFTTHSHISVRFGNFVATSSFWLRTIHRWIIPRAISMARRSTQRTNTTNHYGFTEFDSFDEWCTVLLVDVIYLHSVSSRYVVCCHYTPDGCASSDNAVHFHIRNRPCILHTQLTLDFLSLPISSSFIALRCVATVATALQVLL